MAAYFSHILSLDGRGKLRPIFPEAFFGANGPQVSRTVRCSFCPLRARKMVPIPIAQIVFLDRGAQLHQNPSMETEIGASVRQYLRLLGTLAAKRSDSFANICILHMMWRLRGRH